MIPLWRLVPFCFVVVVAVSGCGGSTGTPTAVTASSSAVLSVDQTAAVTLAFKRYKDAALARDGAAAADSLASTMFAYYDGARNAALTATEQELAAIPPVTRVTVLTMRGSLPADVLRSSSPKQLVVAAVNAGLVGEDGIKNVQFGEVTVSGDTATAAATVQGAPPFKFDFVREDGEWKFDLLPLLDVARMGLETVAKQQGVTVDQLVDTLLVQKYGREKLAQLVSHPVGR